VFSVAIADVDDFKAVNDAYGHEAGDRLLAALGHVLRTATRWEDTCARWGGEKFLFLLPETGPDAVRGLVRKLLAAARSPLSESRPAAHAQR
jgi:diguanylate cyclase (GGDEF)-like protein